MNQSTSGKILDDLGDITIFVKSEGPFGTKLTRWIKVYERNLGANKLLVETLHGPQWVDWDFIRFNDYLSKVELVTTKRGE